MAARIRLLPAALADQIAAGEVVERAASVVKELVENALDAGAGRIDVEIERGGLSRIVVTDDGEGMDREDAHLALRRHATSKLAGADELSRLATFGFRGEALPAIASVSELSLTTRRAADTAAYQVTVRAGEVVATREVGAPVGTRVEVAALFANVPARLKFQKSNGIEASHVVDGMIRVALGCPAVHARLRVDGRAVLELARHPSLAERAHAVLRRSAGHRVVVGSAVVAEGAIGCEAHLAPPEEGVQSARRVHLLVNRRAVRDRGLLAAVQIGFGELLPRGRHPLAVVALTIPSEDVDVNVHPQKLEVRLARPAEAYTAVRRAVAAAVAQAGFAAEPAAAARVDDAPRHAGPPLDLVLDDEPDDDLLRGPERGRAFELVRALARGEAAADAPARADGEPAYLGAIGGGYLAFRDARGVVVIDQHVASALAASVTRPAPDDEVVERALAPTAEVAPAVAIALYAALRALATAGRLPPLAEAAWRGRRALVRIPLSELARRLDS